MKKPKVLLTAGVLSPAIVAVDRTARYAVSHSFLRRTESMRRAALAISLLGAGFAAGACEPDMLDVRQGMRVSVAGPAVLQPASHRDAIGFLPPLGQALPAPGRLDMSVSLSVRICMLAGGSCTATIAEFALQDPTSSAGEGLRANPAAGYFELRWDTRRHQVQAGATYRIEVLAPGLTLGHADVLAVYGHEVHPPAGVAAITPGQTVPVRFRLDSGTVSLVGTDGGSVTFADGSATLDFDVGALDDAVTISVVAVSPGSEGATDASVIAGTQFEFQPSPMDFSAPVRLTLRYPANLPAGIRPGRLSICRMTSGACVPLPGSVVDPVEGTVTATIGSFSSYGVTEFPEALYLRRGEDNIYLHAPGGDLFLAPNTSIVGADTYLSGQPSWSPDGNRIAYVTKGFGNRQLRVMNADGTDNRVLYEGDLRAFTRWSPDGSRILFVWAIHEVGTFPAVINSDGTGLDLLHEIATTFSTHENGIRWTPDGTQLTVYGKLINEPCCTDGIYTVDLDGSKLTRVVHARQGSAFEWSPDGSYLAFHSHAIQGVIEPAGTYVVRANGTGRRLINREYVITGWSPVPGDNRLLFVSNWEYPNDQVLPEGIYTVNANGTGLQQVLAGYVTHANWSPSGQRIAFGGIINYYGSFWHNGTGLINPDGSGLQVMADGQSGMFLAWRP